MKLASLLTPARIALDVDAASRDAVLAAAAQLLCGGDDAVRIGVHTALQQREAMGGTGIGDGVAVPHGRVATLEDARAAFLRLRQPVAFDAPDDAPVDLVIALAVPADFTLQHLNLLADISAHCMQVSVRAGLRAACDPDTILDLLT